MTFQKSTIKKILSILIWVLLLITPLVFSTNTKELFEFPKMFFVYLVGSTVIFIFLLAVVFKAVEFRIPPLEIVAFLGVSVVSTFLSMDFYTSVWGYYSRFNGGLVSYLIFFGLFVVLYSTFSSKNIYRKLFVSLLVSSLPVSIYAIAQHFGIGRSTPVLRAYSTMGQPNWLAAYLGISFLVLINSYLKQDFEKKIFLWFSGTLLVFMGLLFTYSLSGLLGTFLGFLVLLLLNRCEYKKKNLFWISPFILLIVLANPGIFVDKIYDGFQDFSRLFSSAFVVYAQDVNRVSDPGFIRFGLWKGSLKIPFSSLKNFLFGTGLETFPYIFPFYRVAELNYSSEWDYILNKPHNYFIELFVEGGFLSLVIYLFILVKAFFKRHPLTTALLVAYSVYMFFGWPTVVLSLYFWTLLAGVYSYEGN